MPSHAAGDLLVGLLYTESTVTVTHPSGWTQSESSSVSGARALYIDYKIAASGAEAPSWSWAAGDEGHVVVLVIDAGTFDADNPIGGAFFNQGAANFDGTDDWPDRGEVGAVNELLVYSFHGGDDNADTYMKGTPPPTRYLDELSDPGSWHFVTTSGGDKSTYGGYIRACAGDTIAGQSFEGATITSLGYMMAVTVINGVDADQGLTDDFTGTNGDWPSDVWTSYQNNDAGSITQILSNELRLQGKNATNRISSWVRHNKRVTDAEITFDLNIQSGTLDNRWFYVFLRTPGGFHSNARFFNSTTSWTTLVQNSVGFRFRSAVANVVTTSATGAVSTHGTDNPGATGAQTWHFRAELADDVMYVRYWLDGASEPETWNLEQAVTPGVSEGYVMFLDHINASEADWYTIDNFAMTLPSAGGGGASALGVMLRSYYDD